MLVTYIKNVENSCPFIWVFVVVSYSFSLTPCTPQESGVKL